MNNDYFTCRPKTNLTVFTWCFAVALKAESMNRRLSPSGRKKHTYISLWSACSLHRLPFASFERVSPPAGATDSSYGHVIKIRGNRVNANVVWQLLLVLLDSIVQICMWKREAKKRQLNIIQRDRSWSSHSGVIGAVKCHRGGEGPAAAHDLSGNHRFPDD